MSKQVRQGGQSEGDDQRTVSLPAALSGPFPPEAIHWRAQQVYERDGNFSALALAYLDARDVMDRLDKVVGPHCWQDYYDESPRGRVICKLSIEIDGMWITKSDGAGDTAVEGDKGAISDAFKRAAVKWGIGRYLYQLGNTYAPCDAFKGQDGKLRFKKWKPQAQQIFRDALAGIAPEPNREAKVKLDGPHKSITSLEAAIKAFVPKVRNCGDWEEWLDLRSKNEALLEQAERDHPDWWRGWKGMPDNFVPLQDLIDKLEKSLAKQKAELINAG